MLPLYEDTQKKISLFRTKPTHMPPHLHSSIECVYVLEGSLELGIGKELFHMDEGDFGMVFPNMIHHYQVFDKRPGRAVYLMAAPDLTAIYADIMMKKCPRNPVIKAKDVHPDIPYAFRSLNETQTMLKKEAQRKKKEEEMKHPARAAAAQIAEKEKEKEKEKENHGNIFTSFRHTGLPDGSPEETRFNILGGAYLTIMLNRAAGQIELTDKDLFASDDIIYRSVSYLSAHFREDLSLTKMAEDLGYSPSSLSRVFSSTFHSNFNRYLNSIRIDYASDLLRYTDLDITTISENCGFESQRTFNRAFSDLYHMTPRDFRKANQQTE